MDPPCGSSKDRITCHVLDTTTGRPAQGMRVCLEGGLAYTSPCTTTTITLDGGSGSRGDTAAVSTFESLTDEDGRVRTWLPYLAAASAGEVPVYTLDDVLGHAERAGAAATRWTLRFDAADYFGSDPAAAFFPEVAVAFIARAGQNYHLPLLLAPYGYTTYRGT